MEGWVSVHRKLKDWEWYTDGNTFRLFLHFLLSANHKDCKWKGVDVKKGSFITSNDKLASKLGLTVQNIRTSIKKLKTTNEITIKTTSKYTCITLINWDLYQNDKNNNKQTNKQTNKQLTNKQQTTNKQLTTNNNDNNDNNENNDNNDNNENKLDLYFLKNEVNYKELKKLNDQVNYIKDKFNWSNKNDIEVFLSKLKREGKLKEFGIKTTNYLKFLETSKTDKKFKKSFKTWKEEWQNEDWSSKLEEIKPKNQKKGYDDRITYR